MDLDINCSTAPGMLTLLAFPGVGPRGSQLLATRFRTLRDVRDASPALTGKMISARAARELGDGSEWAHSCSRSQAVLQEARDRGSATR